MEEMERNCNLHRKTSIIYTVQNSVQWLLAYPKAYPNHVKKFCKMTYMPSSGRRAIICKLFKIPEIDSQPGGPVRQLYLSYMPARRLPRLSESIPRNRSLGSLKIYKYGLWERLWKNSPYEEKSAIP